MSKRKCKWKTSTNEKQQQNKDYNQHHKNLTGVLPSKAPLLGVFDFSRWIIIFNVKKYFLYICFSKKVFFIKNAFIIISSINKWASWLKTITQKTYDFKILRYKKFKVLKIYLILFFKVQGSMYKWEKQLKTAKRSIWGFMIWELKGIKQRFKVLKIYLAYCAFAKCLF